MARPDDEAAPPVRAALLDFPSSRMYRPASEASALCLPACGVCVYKYYHVAVSCSWVKLLA